GYEINPLCNETKSLRDEIERHRYPNLPGPEVLNTHDSTNCDQDAEMRNGENRPHFTRMKSLALQQKLGQTIAHSALASDNLLQIQASNIADQIIRSLVSSFVQIQALEPMQICLSNDLSPSISDQNLATEQQPASPKYGRSLPPGGCKLILQGY